MRKARILLVIAPVLVAVVALQALAPPDAFGQGPVDVQPAPTPTRPPGTGKPAAPEQKPAATPTTASAVGQPTVPRPAVAPVSLPRTGGGLQRDSDPAVGWVLFGSALAAVALGTAALAASRARRRSQ